MRLPTGTSYRTPLSRASLAENVSRLGEKFREFKVARRTYAKRTRAPDFGIDPITAWRNSTRRVAPNGRFKIEEHV